MSIKIARHRYVDRMAEKNAIYQKSYKSINIANGFLLLTLTLIIFIVYSNIASSNSIKGKNVFKNALLNIKPVRSDEVTVYDYWKSIA